MPDTKSFNLPSVTGAQALAEAANGALLVDLRPARKVAADGRRIVGAETRDALDFGHTDPLTSDPRRLIVFCQKGEEVGQFGCALLMIHNRDVAYVAGGILAMIEAGADTVPAEQNA